MGPPAGAGEGEKRATGVSEHPPAAPRSDVTRARSVIPPVAPPPKVAEPEASHATDEAAPLAQAAPGADRSVPRATELPPRLVALIAALVAVAFAVGFVLGLVVH